MSERKPLSIPPVDDYSTDADVARLSAAIAKTILEQEPSDPEVAAMIAQYKLDHRAASVTDVETATDVVLEIGKLSFPDCRLDQSLRRLSQGVAALLLADSVGRQKLLELWGE